MKTKEIKPLVYSCSGCSSAAQMANSVAVKLDRQDLAEMSCIVGIGGDVLPLVNKAKSGRLLVVIDGCPMECGAHCLAKHHLKPDLHFDLSKLGVAKKLHQDFDKAQAEEIYSLVASEISKKVV